MKVNVKELIKKYETNNPFIIAIANKIILSYSDLGNIRSYYTQIENKKFINVNENLPWYERRFEVAHCLHYALTNNEEKVIYSNNVNDLPITIKTLEANKFALELILSPNDLTESITYREVCFAKGMSENEYQEARLHLSKLMKQDIEKMKVRDIFKRFTELN